MNKLGKVGVKKFKALRTDIYFETKERYFSSISLDPKSSDRLISRELAIKLIIRPLCISQFQAYVAFFFRPGAPT